MPEQTVFEHPLTEKCRTWLRLSHLFEQFDFHVAHDEEWLVMLQHFPPFPSLGHIRRDGEAWRWVPVTPQA